MAVNSYKDDELTIERSKVQTLARLFRYLLDYKWQIILVLIIMGYGVAVSLVNPLIMESAIDDHISVKDLSGLSRLLAVALVINLFLLIVGMVMDTTPAILILTPILLPIVEAISMNPVQFGVIMVVNLAIGFVTPPYGVNLFVASAISNLRVEGIIRRIWLMIGLMILCLMVITFWEPVTMGLVYASREAAAAALAG